MTFLLSGVGDGTGKGNADCGTAGDGDGMGADSTFCTSAFPALTTYRIRPTMPQIRRPSVTRQPSAVRRKLLAIDPSHWYWQGCRLALVLVKEISPARQP